MRYVPLLALLITGCFSSISAVPSQLFNQRSQPMGNVKPTQHLKQPAISAPAQNQYLLSDMPVRFQWFANNGYCGETSLISAGLKYGQYVSQYVARSTVNTGGSQSTQVLLGNNDGTAADAMHLKYAPRWNEQDTEGFLTWIKAYILNGYPVIIGIYTNECLFYDNCRSPASQGDDEYDHIVPVLGILSYGSIAPPPLPPDLSSYMGSDSIIFSDNGLQGPEDNPTGSPCLPNPANPYQFTNTFDGFQANRKQANTNNRWYSLSSETNTYGIAILGIRDDDNDTIPVTVATCLGSTCPISSSGNSYVNYEFPSIVDGSNTQPMSMPLTLTITITIPDQTKAYNVYRYDDLANIPNSQFNANAGNASEVWHIPPGSGSTYLLTQNIMSNEVAAYRAVAATAP